MAVTLRNFIGAVGGERGPRAPAELSAPPPRAPRALDRSAGEARRVCTGSNRRATRPLRILLLQGAVEKSLQNSDRVSFSRKIRTHLSSHLSHLGVHHRPGGQRTASPRSTRRGTREFTFGCDCPVHPRALLIFLDPSSGIILTSAHTQLLGCWASCCGLCACDQSVNQACTPAEPGTP